MNYTYGLACLYMGRTELYDRTLTDMRDKYDPQYCKSESNSYASRLRNQIIEDYNIPWSEIQKEICKHTNYSAQMWIDEYYKIWDNTALVT